MARWSSRKASALSRLAPDRATTTSAPTPPDGAGAAGACRSSDTPAPQPVLIPTLGHRLLAAATRFRVRKRAQTSEITRDYRRFLRIKNPPPVARRRISILKSEAAYFL